MAERFRKPRDVSMSWGFCFFLFYRYKKLNMSLRLIPIILILLVSCTSQNETNNQEKKLTEAEKIAQAHGYDNWQNVSSFAFTFNVDRAEQHYECSWEWDLKTQNVVMMQDGQTIAFNTEALDSTSQKADESFINDKYWALFPFQLVWDTTALISDPIKAQAPISKTELNKIVLTYPIEGGYTPGDAYDIFYGDDYLIKEWVFRAGNSDEASLTNTFESYEDFNGIKIAREHKMDSVDWNLHFTNVNVTMR